MAYHPILGISIFVVAIIISFYLGKNALKKLKNHENKTALKDNESNPVSSRPPKGEITSPDAPWLEK